MKKTVIWILAAVLLLGSLWGCSSKSKGFDTPEAAVEAFLEAFRTQDVEKMLSCCYTEPFLEHLDFEDYVDQIRSAAPSMLAGPVQYDYYKELVRTRILGDYAGKIQMMSYSILSEDLGEFADGIPVLADAQWAAGLAEDADPAALKELEIIQILDALDTVSKDQRKTYIRSLKANCGADDGTELVAVLELDGEYYTKGFTLVEYDGSWYIRNLNAIIYGEASTGAAARLEDEDALEDLLEEYD